MSQICDRDCFNCRFDDCICDEMTADDWKAARGIDDFIHTKTAKEKSIEAYKKQYYEENRESIAAYQKKYREENRESIAAYKKQYYKENRKTIAAKQKKYREENSESIAAYQKQYYEENRESIAAKQKKYCEENRESIAAYQKQYYEENRESIAAKQKKYREENRESLISFGDALRAVRKRLKLSQADAGRLVGLSQRQVSYYERGEVPFDLSIIEKLKGYESRLGI